MKIIVKSKNKNIKLRLPLSLIKSKFIYKIVLKNSKENTSILYFYNNRKKIYKIIKDYLKNNGHFNLVEVENENDKVIIRI